MANPSASQYISQMANHLIRQSVCLFSVSQPVNLLAIQPPSPAMGVSQ